MELRARRGVASTCEGAYMDVRNRAGTQLQRCIATQMRRFSFRVRTIHRRSRNSTESGTKKIRPSQTILPVGNFTPPQRIVFSYYSRILPLCQSFVKEKAWRDSATLFSSSKRKLTKLFLRRIRQPPPRKSATKESLTISRLSPSAFCPYAPPFLSFCRVYISP